VPLYSYIVHSLANGILCGMLTFNVQAIWNQINVNASHSWWLLAMRCDAMDMRYAILPGYWPWLPGLIAIDQDVGVAVGAGPPRQIGPRIIDRPTGICAYLPHTSWNALTHAEVEIRPGMCSLLSGGLPKSLFPAIREFAPCCVASTPQSSGMPRPLTPKHFRADLQGEK